jgi:hypothetical protein
MEAGDGLRRAPAEPLSIRVHLPFRLCFIRDERSASLFCPRDQGRD